MNRNQLKSRRASAVALHPGLPARSTRGADRECDLKRFRPLAAQARTAVDDLVGRGAVPVKVREDLVVLRRMNQVAQVDAFGRVTWDG